MSEFPRFIVLSPSSLMPGLFSVTSEFGRRMTLGTIEECVTFLTDHYPHTPLHYGLETDPLLAAAITTHLNALEDDLSAR